MHLFVLKIAQLLLEESSERLYLSEIVGQITQVGQCVQINETCYQKV